MTLAFDSARAATRALSRAHLCAAALAALLLAGCQTTQQQDVAAAPRGATVAFDSIDGLPPGQFRRLVDDLNEEAQTRRLAVLSRAQKSAYRVRGYFAAAVEKGQTTVSWVFDVFDRDERRALRISGSTPFQGKDWHEAEPALMQKVAQSSMAELAGFLTSPAADVTVPDTEADKRLALAGDDSPEAAGIFRMAHTDPLAGPAPEHAAR